MPKLDWLLKRPALLDVLCLVSGLLLTLAFSPFDFWPLALLCPMVLYIGWINTSLKRTALRGLYFGMGFFTSGIYWVYFSIHTYGNTGVITSCLAVLLLAFGMALHIALQGVLLNLLFKKHSWQKCVLGFPALWVLFEWVRSWSWILFGGFPWLYLGYSEVHTPLSGYAPIFSVYGVSLFSLISSGLLLGVVLFTTWRRRINGLLCIAFIWLIGWGLQQVHWTHPIHKPIKVSLVQGNIPIDMKWKPSTLINSMKTYRTLTDKHWDSRLIIWPETGIPALYQNPKVQAYLDKVSIEANAHRSAVLVGLPSFNEATNQYFNSAVVVGNGYGMYYKRHLVPFGEYIPLLNVIGKVLGFLNIPMSDFASGPTHQQPLHMSGFKVGLFICYEIAFPSEVSESIKQLSLLASISDDAWFGNSIGRWQHMQIAQMRALENGRYLMRATSDGITSIIAPNGKITAQLKQFVPGVLTSTVVPYGGVTPWDRYGISMLLILLCLMLALAYFLCGEKSK